MQITQNIFTIIVFSLILLIAFRFLQILSKKFIPEKFKNKINQALSFIEFIVWFAFLYHIAENLKHNKPVLSLIAIILLILLAIWTFWFILKDYFAGLYFKIFEDYKIDNRIRFNNTSGTIIALENRYLILQNSEGNIKIPYSKFFGQQIIKLPEKHEEEFIISIYRTKITDEYIDKLQQKVMLLPWINRKYAPEINVNGNAENYKIEIKIVLINAKYKSNVEEYLTTA